MNKTHRTNGAGIDRRELVKAGTLVAGGLMLGSSLGEARTGEAVPATGFRFAFLPCIHFRLDLGSPKGLEACLASVGRLEPKPAFLLTGGDICHNLRDESLAASRERIKRFKEVWSGSAGFPSHHCLGNHDLAAWNDPKNAQEPDYGKGLLLKELAMPGAHYAFDHGGWHFVVLDYLKQEAPGSFSPEIDGAQLDWLRQDLRAAGSRPTMLITHAPFLSAFEAFTDRGVETEKGRLAPFGRIVKNLPQVLKVLDETGANVRGLLSGHLHLVEEVVYGGRRFICSGSVSGQQWNGPRLGCQEGFGVLDCRPDGTFDFSYRDYGWNA